MKLFKFIPTATIIFGFLCRYFWEKRLWFLIFLTTANLGAIVIFLPQYYNTEEFYVRSVYQNSLERHQYNLFIKEHSTNNDVIFSLEEILKFGGKLQFTVAPYMWWRDNIYRQRNLNRAPNLNAILLKIEKFNVPADKFLVIIRTSDYGTDNRLKDLEVLAKKGNP